MDDKSRLTYHLSEIIITKLTISLGALQCAVSGKLFFEMQILGNLSIKIAHTESVTNAKISPLLLDF